MSNRYLPTALRRALEKAVKDARIVAEEGARDSVRRLGIADNKAPNYLADTEKELRRRLRAHARALGDVFDRTTDTQETKRLIEATAYAHWHRMLFARFLAERELLQHPAHNVPVSLEDCRELAEAEGLSDAWAVAERYSAAMLPAVFRLDDPVLALDFDAVYTQKLNHLVTGLDEEVFQAEDSLGWTYQFWRAAEKDSINESGVKIGADELPAVTQLFTEPYMVRFLLHNTLGAWWASRVLASHPKLAEGAPDEQALRAACALPDYDFDMLRFVREGVDGPWRPAAGSFIDWPREAKAITVLDPCCGSGHFLTEALAIIAALRQAEEALSSSDSVAAVLRDNLHGLEIDGRCVQIAAFAVALTAWRIGGWQPLPLPHIAWVGSPPPLPKKEFAALAEGDSELEYALAALHDLFGQAPILGSLLEPVGEDLFEDEKMGQIERLLEPVLEKARRAEPDQAEGAIAARGMADAVKLLHQRYVLQCTNVPFLGRGRQTGRLAEYLEKRFPDAKADLATAMLLRMRSLAVENGSMAVVSPQSWLYLGAYKGFRKSLLSDHRFDLLASLGTKAFETIGGEVVSVSLLALSFEKPRDDWKIKALDCNHEANARGKAEALKGAEIRRLDQYKQVGNPDSRISFSTRNQETLVREYAETATGIQTFDRPRFIQSFWEQDKFGDKWIYLQTSPEKTAYFDGCTLCLLWENGLGQLFDFMEAKRNLEGYTSGIWRAGSQFWGKPGVLINLMGDMPATLYCGYAFDQNVGFLGATDPKYLNALWSFASSSEFITAVREVDQSLKVTNATLGKIPFDLERWKDAQEGDGLNSLPEPESDSPAQWLFHGHPAKAERGAAIHVALARLCGYRWPAETDPNMRLSGEAQTWIAKSAILPAGDHDGLLGVPAVAGEKPLADRLRNHLAAAFGKEWSDEVERRLVAEADEVFGTKASRDGSLEGWLRDRAFRQHCAFFGQRPFLWQIWDGLKDGFSVFVHYHRFDQSALRKLTYTLLGDWLARAKAEGNQLRYEKGRELQQMLEKILEGEKPFDIFARWKSLRELPLGWEPDLCDGVRINIRPFVEAGILRDTPKVKWSKDRGNDVSSAPWYPIFNGERINDHHTTVAERQGARDSAKKRVDAK